MRRPAMVVAVAAVLMAMAGAGTASADPRPQGTYVALGDSYSSGVGTRDYSFNAPCKRGPYAYPWLVDLSLEATFVFRACGGATTADVIANQLNSVTSDDTYVTISIGGNDAGFSHVITQCAKPWPTTCWGDIDNAQSFIANVLPKRLRHLYGRIRRLAPHATRVAVGYPRLFNGETCNGGARISSGEEQRLNDTADLLARVTRRAAHARGFRFVDPRNAFAGHEICSDHEWLNGLSNPTSESYHPNRDGHRAYAQLVLAKLR